MEDVNKDRLHCIESGFPVSKEIELDILRADELSSTLLLAKD